MSTHHWQRLHGVPVANGAIKTIPSDFIVEEILGFNPSENGEHVALDIEKTNANTVFVAEQLAKFASISVRDVGYAGRKDKIATTRQWFTVNDRGADKLDWQAFNIEGVIIRKVTRHHRKIKIGSHRGNRFIVTVRDLICRDRRALIDRFKAITEQGFINYFGQQRFGEMKKHGAVTYNGNLSLAQRLLEGEQIRNRNKRNIVISALRSWLFNEVASRRIADYGHTTMLNGDALILSGSNSFFVCDEKDAKDLNGRLLKKDIQLSAPLWGSGQPHSMYRAREFETSIANEYGNITKILESLQLKQQRRPIIAFPCNVDYQLEDDQLSISFELEKGCFATSLLREFMRLKHEEYYENLVEQ
ncbi:MAG: tRNA pseudouridine(13) synthase TruD [Pseudomonadota bacterium]